VAVVWHGTFQSKNAVFELHWLPTTKQDGSMATTTQPTIANAMLPRKKVSK
jgi:hypothetical protein